MRARAAGLALFALLDARQAEALDAPGPDASADAPVLEPPIDPKCFDTIMGCGVMPPGAVVVTGSRALLPVLRRMSTDLKKETGIEIYYLQNDSQCQGARQVIEQLDVSGGADHLGSFCCTLPAGTHADMWVTDSPVEDCLGDKKPAGYGDYLGPIASYAMVVPSASLELAITMEEAYFVFGFGGAGYQGQPVAPWTDPVRILIPSNIFGTRALWSRFLRLPGPPRPDRPQYLVPGDLMKGLDRGSPESAMYALGTESLGGPGAIVLTTSQTFDASPGANTLVRTLAIQSFEQRRAFYADSTARALDKRNVREGRYPYWAPIHMVTKVDPIGRPLNARAQSVISYLQQTASMAGFNVLDAIVGGRLIPQCAMKVQRKPGTGVAGELVPYVPPPGTACGCYMDNLLSRGSSGCAPCSESKPCTGGKTCSNGFCE